MHQIQEWLHKMLLNELMNEWVNNLRESSFGRKTLEVYKLPHS